MTHSSSAAQLEAVEPSSPNITVSHELQLTLPAGEVKDVTVTSATFTAYRDFQLVAFIRGCKLDVSLRASGDGRGHEFVERGKPMLKVNQSKVRIIKT